MCGCRLGIENQSLDAPSKVEMRPIQRPIPQSSRSSTSGSLVLDASQFINERKGSIVSDYNLLEEIGSGGFGQVIKARHKLSGQMRAVKKIYRGMHKDNPKIANEVEILKHLDHPNIVKIYEFYQDLESIYLVTELCEGGELFEKIIQHKTLDEQMVADIMQSLLSAVYYCHSKNVVHRDIKPENILLESTDHIRKIKIIDFGTSRIFQSNQPMKELYGTVYYMAPDVFTESYNEKCDEWSCGVIMYLMLCGYPPFNGRTDGEILRKIQNGQFTFRHKIWEVISEEAKDLIQKLLTFDPEVRISAEKALEHEWFVKYKREQTKEDYVVLKQSLTNLVKFNAEKQLQGAVLTLIAHQLYNRQKEIKLKKLFQQLDTNGNGLLDPEEIIDGLTLFEGDRTLAQMQTDKVLQKLDLNRNENIDYTEFIIANMEMEEVCTVNKLQTAFKIFDINGDGHISLDELKVTLAKPEGDEDDLLWQEIIDEVDMDGDGKISFNEFMLMMFKLYIDEPVIKDY